MLRRLVLVAPVALACLGCPPRVKPGKTPILQDPPPPGTVTSRPSAAPNPHAAAPAGSQGAAPATPSAAAALPPTGHNSQEQLAAEAAKLDDPRLRAAFEEAFVLVFHQDRAARRVDRARELLRPLLEANFAPAWRIQGYTYIDQGFQMEPAIAAYRRAVEADPSYGMAHYALAFTLTQTDRVAGKRHFQRALELGVQDQRSLGTRFYPD